MSEPFRIGFEWLSNDHGSAVERATFAQLDIETAGKRATVLEDLSARTVRRYVRASAYHLALWLTANWWRLRWEPEQERPSPDWALSHSIAGVGEGYVWPDLRLSSDGETVLADSHPTEGGGPEPIRYLNRFRVPIQADAFEQGVDRFVEAVLERLSVHVAAAPLNTLWQELREERSDPEATAWRRMEAKLGFDPDEAEEELLERLKGLAKEAGQAATEEVAVVAKAEAPDTLVALLASKDRSIRIGVPHVGQIRLGAMDAVSTSAPPWLRGAAAAQMARITWGFGSGPLPSAMLSDLFSIPRGILKGQIPPSEAPMPVGFREANEDGSLRVVLTKRSAAGRRFALARVVGAHVFCEDDRMLPATNSKTARQKFQRSFAQELLCPFRDLVEYINTNTPSDDHIEDAAHHFGVSPLLVESTLVNNNYINQPIR